MIATLQCTVYYSAHDLMMIIIVYIHYEGSIQGVLQGIEVQFQPYLTFCDSNRVECQCK